MNLTLTEEQRLLAGTARAFVGRGDASSWTAMAGLGWTGLLVAEAHGGAGRGMEDVVLVAEALGRGPVPLPFVVSSVLATVLLAGAGTPRWLPGLADGTTVATVALAGRGARDEWAGPAAVLRDGVLQGTAALVPWAETAGVVLVVARAGDGLVLAPVVTGHRLSRHADLGADPLYEVALDGVPVAGDKVVPITKACLDRALDHAAVAALAYAVGAAERAAELAVEHARTREQFGRPIGSFQATAHRCVDMRTDVDACRWLAYQAAWALDRGGDAGLEVGAAKAYANEALQRVARHAHQVLGAIGFSTEHDLHRFTRRLKAFELSYGGTARHRDRVARAIGL